MIDTEELGKLGELFEKGILTEEEFARAKARILGGATCEAPPRPTFHPLDTFRRSRDDRWFGGVCGGLGQFTGVPPWVWRILFIFSLGFAGTGVLLYILMWIFVPVDHSWAYSAAPGAAAAAPRSY